MGRVGKCIRMGWGMLAVVVLGGGVTNYLYSGES